MKQFKLTYGRSVVLTRIIEADNEADALTKATQLEVAGELGLDLVFDNKDNVAITVKEGSQLETVDDDEGVWEVEADE